MYGMYVCMYMLSYGVMEFIKITQRSFITDYILFTSHSFSLINHITLFKLKKQNTRTWFVFHIFSTRSRTFVCTRFRSQSIISHKIMIHSK